MNKETLLKLFGDLSDNQKVILKASIIASFYVYLIIFLFYPTLINLDLLKIAPVCFGIAEIISSIIFILLNNSFKGNTDLSFGVITGMNTGITVCSIIFGAAFGVSVIYVIIISCIFGICILGSYLDKKSKKKPQHQPIINNHLGVDG